MNSYNIIIIIFISDSNNINHTELVIQSEGCQRSLCSLTGGQIKQEAQLLLGDRATRKHAKDC